MCKTLDDCQINGVNVPFLFKKEIIKLPESLLVGKGVTYPMAKQGVAVEDGGNPPLNLVWQEYKKDGTRDWLLNNKHKMHMEVALGLYYDINIDNSGMFSYIVGALMDINTPAPATLASHKILAGDFAVCWYKYTDNDDIWSIAHSTVEAYLDEIGYEGNGICSELYLFDERNDGFNIMGYLIACKKRCN